jgi:hypothetical protein
MATGSATRVLSPSAPPVRGFALRDSALRVRTRGVSARRDKGTVHSNKPLAVLGEACHHGTRAALLSLARTAS